MKVLLAEDDELLRLTLARNIADSGFAVIGVPNGEQALLEFQHQECPLILTDLHMPIMNGCELCKNIRLQHQGTVPAIILCSSESSDSDLMAFIEAGGDDFITKPVDMRVLRARLMLATRLVKQRQHQLDVKLHDTTG